jgi:hypothetical protein
MTTSRGVSALATAALLLVAVTACVGGGKEPAARASHSPSSPAPNTATSTPPSETEIASTAASALVERYYAVRNELRQQPKQPLDRLKTVAISTELAAQEKLFKTERRQGLHQVGETNIAKLQVQAVNLDNSDPKAGKVPTVQVDVCFDVSDVDIVDANGESVIDSDRPGTGWIRYLVANHKSDTNPDGGWRVASSQDIEQTPCAAS